MREIVCHIQVHPGWDAIFIARADAVNASFVELAEAVSGLLGRAGLKIKE
jgi:RNase P protein component